MKLSGVINWTISDQYAHAYHCQSLVSPSWRENTSQ